MSSVAHLPLVADLTQQTALVAACHDHGFSVRTHVGLLRADRAASCLLAPKLGDLVLVATSDSGQSWILAVLRQDAEETAIEVEGDLRIRSRTGQVIVSAREDVRIAAGRTVGVAASGFEVNAATANLVLDSVRYAGRALAAELESLRTVATTVESVVERFSQRVKRSFRQVAEIDSVKANHIDYAAESTLHLRGDHAIVTAERLVKLDGKQIHVG